MSSSDLSPVKRALLALEKMSARVQELEQTRTEPIAIVGMACRVPGASDPERFWQLLNNGVDAVGEVPKSRWDVDAVYDPDADKPGKIASRRGGFIEAIDEFDPEFFGISPREALAMDPQQRLLLEVAWEALENAGQSPSSLADSPTGVFVGISSDEYGQMFHKAGDVNRFDMYFASGVARSVAAGRISYVLGLHGPSLSIDTACSSSLVAVHTACLHLRAGECRAALAGGVNIILSPEITMALSRGHMFAADGRCKTFDAAADGFVRAEGCGMVVLKKLSDAIADGDNILALIRGSAVNQDGRSSGLTVPNGPAQEAVIRQALANGKVDAADIDYVEAHGTGTSLGDPIEAHALAAVLGAGRAASRPLVVGSVKTNLGHMEAAAGVAGLIKVILSLEHQRIPPHLHFHSMNPHIDWKGVPVEIPVEGKDWKSGSKPRLAGVSSFGFSGTNAHVVLQEAPAQEPRKGSQRDVHVLALSARSEAALATLARSYAARLSEPEIDLGEVCFTANTGRSHFSERAVYVGSTREQLEAKLAEGTGLRGPSQPGESLPGEGLRIAFLFSGQGAQYAGMGRELYQSEPVFRTAMDACAAAVKDQLKPGLIDVLYGNSTELLDDTRYTQPALFAIEYSLAALWRSWGVEPAVVLGHSVGEYAAACVAGLYSLEDGMRLITARARMMSDLPHGEGSMAAILALLEQVQPAVEADGEWVSVAGLNGPENTVISGRTAEVERISAGLASAGVRVERLRVSHAFHSPLMNPILDAFAARAAQVEFRAPRIVLVSSLTGQAAKLAELRDPEYWRRQVREPVRFQQGMGTLAAQGCNLLVEIGPGSTLLGMGRACVRSKNQLWAPSIRKARNDAQEMAESLAALYVRGVEVDWNGYEGGRGRHRVALPTYPFERQRYWIDDLAPARSHSPAPGEHPLLGRRIHVASDPGTSLWQSLISLVSHPWIGDHRVQGVVILPMTAYLEMMSAAMAGPVSDVVIREPLIVPGNGAVEVQVAVKANSVEVYSRQGETWKLHASGKPGVSKPGTEIGLTALRQGLSTRVAAEQFYRDLAARGHAFGPCFRLVSEIFSGPSEALTEVDAVSPQENGYRFHPAVLDACVQTIAAAMDPSNTDSFLPVGVGHFEILKDQISGRIWSHATIEQGAEVLTANVVILDANGRTLVQIHGLELRRMTAEAISRFEGTAAGNVFFAPVWEPEHPLNLAAMAASVRSETALITERNSMDRYPAFRQRMDVACAQAIRIAFEQLGVPRNFGARFRASDVALRCGVLKRFSLLLNRFLEILGEDGILRQTGAFWEYVLLPPAGPTDWKGLEQRFPEFATETRMVARCAEGLSGVLRGTINELQLLFPGGSTEAAERLYSQSPSARAFNELLSRVIPGAIPENGKVKILEIGGGTGGTSSFVLPLLPADRTSYVFTDISPLFVSRARERFAEYGFVSYTTLNIEQDPLAQGLRAGEFDMVIAANVLHATADLKTTLAGIRTLLKPGGVIVMLEVARKERWIDVTFGLTDGWWRFTDRQLRPSYPLLPPEQWKSLLEDNGFADAQDIQAGSDSLNAIVFAKKASPASRLAGKWLVTGRAEPAAQIAIALEQRGAQCTLAGDEQKPMLAGQDWAGVVFVAPEGDEKALCQPFLALIREFHNSTGQLVIVTVNAQPAIPSQPASQPVDPAQATLWGLGRTIALECPGLKVTCVDLDAGQLAEAGETVARQVCATDGETEVAYRGGVRFLNRVRPVRLQDRSSRLRLSVERRGAVDNLQIEAATRRAPGAGQVEIEVDIAGIGFRDVLNALGMYPGDPGRLGAECAGRVAAVGEGVTGFKPGDEVIALAAGAHDGYVLADAALVVRRPAGLPVEDAMTMPVPYVTALYALEHLGKIRRGERVLIHSGAGGVGLAAIRVAQRAGAEIFATAGSEAKRERLRSLGVQHVMDSRSARFADQIRQITNGQGVDLVLNSLAGDTIGASFACIGKGGRFLEIGKNGIWSAEQVQALGKDISYFVIDWSAELSNASGNHTSLISGLLKRSLEDAGGALPPLPRTVFAFPNAQAAYRHMMQGRHTGRILLRQEAPIAIRPDRTYLITGGLKGIGWITAESLAARGAKHLVLVGRHEPTPEARERISGLERQGTQVRVAIADVAERLQMDRLFESVKASMPPLGGVVHSAGTLDDALLGDQTWTRFESVFRSKIRGTWNLHELTAGAPMDFFLLYSSIASVLGAPGQANHAAASAFEDAFAWMRRAQGLPATSINWGAWRDTGSADRAEYERRRERLGLSAFTPAQGIQYLDRVLAVRPAQIAVAQMDWKRYADGRPLGKSLEPMLDAADHEHVSAKTDTGRKADAAPALLDELRAAPESNRLRVLQNHVQSLAARTLGLAAGKKIDDRRPLNELGLDSLMAVEFRNALAAAVGRPLPVTLLFSYPALGDLANFLAAELWGAAKQPAASAPSVIDAVEELSDEEVDRLLAEKMGAQD